MLACPELRRLDPLLARHRLTDAETGQVVLSALKVELSQVCGVGGCVCGCVCFVCVFFLSLASPALTR